MGSLVKSILSKSPLLMLVLRHLKRYYINKLAVLDWKKLTNQSEIKLNLGSGPVKGTNGWTTVDTKKADISYDLSHGIPLPDNSVSTIYSSHMLEHIPYENQHSFLMECYRVLQPEGSLLIAVPNAGLYIQAYLNKKMFKDVQNGILGGVNTSSYIDQVNYIAYMAEDHKYMFDEENLINTLKKAPFKTVSAREFDARLDIQARDYESIYAIAKK